MDATVRGDGRCGRVPHRRKVPEVRQKERYLEAHGMPPVMASTIAGFFPRLVSVWDVPRGTTAYQPEEMV